MRNKENINIIKRLDIFLEDGLFDEAKQYCDKLLDSEPENSIGYLYKTMIDFKVTKADELYSLSYIEVYNNVNYKRYLKYLEDKEKKEVIDKWNEINYNNSKTYIDNDNLKNAKDLLELLGDYKDLENLLMEVNEKLSSNEKKKKEKIIKIVKIAIPVVLIVLIIANLIGTNFYKEFSAKFYQNIGNYEKSVVIYESLGEDYIKNNTELQRSLNYSNGMIKYKNKEYKDAIEYFRNSKDYKDSVNKYFECEYIYALDRWEKGYLREAYDLMKSVYMHNSNYELNGGAKASEVLTKWIKDKDKINYLGSFKVERNETITSVITKGYNNITSSNEIKNDSDRLVSLEADRVVGDTVYYTLKYTFILKSVSASNRADTEYDFKIHTHEFMYNLKTNKLLKTYRKHDNGEIEISAIGDNNYIFLSITNKIMGYLAFYDNIMYEVEVLTMKKTNADITDTVNSFIDTSSYKDGFNDDVYKKKKNSMLATNEWIEENGKWYYFGDDSKLARNKWVGQYYVDNDGVMLKDQITPDGYYVDKDGVYVSNKILDDKTVYGADGKVVKNNWVQINSSYYYTDSEGKYLSDQWVDGGNYYVGSDGKMLTDTTSPDGRKVDANGKKIKTFAEQVKAAKIVSSYPDNTVVDQMDTVIFGSFSQSDPENGKKDPIEWIVLEKEDNKALLISKYLLDCNTYNTGQENITWEKSTVRNYLNGVFINNAFSSVEQSNIINTNVIADKNPKWDTNSGNDTKDKVFLLSINEVNKYFSSNAKRICKPTQHAKKRWKLYLDFVPTLGLNYATFPINSSWWLRSPGNVEEFAAMVNDDGSVNDSGTKVQFPHNLRPAIWVSY